MVAKRPEFNLTLNVFELLGKLLKMPHIKALYEAYLFAEIVHVFLNRLQCF